MHGTTGVVLDYFADRIGRLATDDMLLPTGRVPTDYLERQLAIGGGHAASMVLYAVQNYLDDDEFADFVEAVRDAVAGTEEMAA